MWHMDFVIRTRDIIFSSKQWGAGLLKCFQNFNKYVNRCMKSISPPVFTWHTWSVKHLPINLPQKNRTALRSEHTITIFVLHVDAKKTSEIRDSKAPGHQRHRLLLCWMALYVWPNGHLLKPLAEKLSSTKSASNFKLSWAHFQWKKPNPPDNVVVNKTICVMKSVISLFESAVICTTQHKLVASCYDAVVISSVKYNYFMDLSVSLDLRKNLDERF